jgi:uncharacterized protein DUF3800
MCPLACEGSSFYIVDYSCLILQVIMSAAPSLRISGARRRKCLLPMLKAYIDDSCMNKAPVYVLAGWCAPARVWGPFSNAWRDILRYRRRIDRFKFDEAINFSGEFLNMSVEDRDERLRLLVGAIEEHGLVGFSVIIPHHIFLPLFGVHPSIEVRNPYHLAFFMMVSRMVAHYAPLGIKDKIDFYFDYQPGAKSMALVEEGWELFCRLAPQEVRPLLNAHPPSFLSDDDTVPLQAADLIAGWVRYCFQANLLGRPPPTAPWLPKGSDLPLIYRELNEESAEKIFVEMFGFKPVRFSYAWNQWPLHHAWFVQI